ncbi:MAG: FG-GAP-like repeat-containing protein, partial [Candidatus Andersenbacteria bacterium]
MRRTVTNRHSPRAHAQLRVRRRFAPLYTILPALRGLALLTLIVSLVVGGFRFLTRADDVAALDFTAHKIGQDRNAIGILGITTGDIDADGDDDIVTAGKDGIKVYQNEGDFRFTTHIIDEAYGERVQVVDLNKDGTLDILVTIKGGDAAIKWYRNNGELDFSPTVLLTAGEEPFAYAGDLDNDGDADIVTARGEADGRTVSRWMNEGGTFVETVLESNVKVTAVTIGDASDNEYTDIVTVGPPGLQRWSTNDGITWTRSDIDDTKPNRTHVVVSEHGDDGHTIIVTGDHDTDIVAYYHSDLGVEWHRNQVATEVDAKTVLPIDFDKDGDLDIIVTAQDQNAVYWFDNRGTDGFTKRTIASNLQSVFGVAVADFDQDGDYDFVTADFFRGPLLVHERLRAQPKATAPTNIQQSTSGTGIVTFTTTISDADFDPTRARITYSHDGIGWDKPWLTKVTASKGSVDLKNSNAFQVGTNNAIDTNDHDTVTLTFTWDTKSIQNTGGPITGEEDTMYLRIVPRDSKNQGAAAKSAAFHLDNAPPQGLSKVTLTSISNDEATFTWLPATDSSEFVYKIFYSTNAAEVLDGSSDAWDAEKDAALGDIETKGTTITGLTPNETYTFKVVVTDEFGNSSAAPSLRGTTTTAAADTPPDDGTPPVDTTPDEEPVDEDPPVDEEPEPEPPVEEPPSEEPPIEEDPPTVLDDNRAPVADAGPDQLVNPTAIVVLDGTASADPDGDSLVYRWRQIDGPKVNLLSDRTANPTFNAGEEYETYIFAVTIRDTNGATATDNVTVATKALPVDTGTPVTINPTSPPLTDEPVEPVPPLVSTLLHPADIVLFILSLLSTLLLIIERMLHSLRQKGRTKGGDALDAAALDRGQPQGRVVHYKTGEPIVNAQVLIYGQDGKLRATERTNAQGIFPTFFPVGEYTIGVQAEGFTFASAAPRSLAPEGGMLYTGGKLTVRNANTPLA